MKFLSYILFCCFLCNPSTYAVEKSEELGLDELKAFYQENKPMLEAFKLQQKFHEQELNELRQYRREISPLRRNLLENNMKLQKVVSYLQQENVLLRERKEKELDKIEKPNINEYIIGESLKEINKKSEYYIEKIFVLTKSRDIYEKEQDFKDFWKNEIKIIYDKEFIFLAKRKFNNLNDVKLSLKKSIYEIFNKNFYKNNYLNYYLDTEKNKISYITTQTIDGENYIKPINNMKNIFIEDILKILLEDYTKALVYYESF